MASSCTQYQFTSVPGAIAACNLANAHGYPATAARQGNEGSVTIKAADAFIDKIITLQGGNRSGSYPA